MNSTSSTSDVVAIGADHAGFPLKVELVALLHARGVTVLDLGTHSADPVDYPDIAEAVGGALQQGRARRGILVCGSGAGACIAANKLTGVRAAVCHDTYSAHQAVEHDDANILCLGSRIIGGALAEELLDTWLGAAFAGEDRFVRRLNKVVAIEATGIAAPNA